MSNAGSSTKRLRSRVCRLGLNMHGYRRLFDLAVYDAPAHR